jgi:predicted SAM-dependent methyltransferase
MSDPLRLNLGCGLTQVAGFLGVDLDPELHPDVVADVESLPFEDDSVDEIYASHVLEHVPYDSPALTEWNRVLKPGGLITIIVPDIIQTYYLWKHGMKWGPYKLPIDEQFINATAFGAYLLAETVPEGRFTKMGHEHKQIFIYDMLIQQMLRHFEEVTEVFACSVRQVTFGETMAQGRKPRHLAPECYSDEPWCLRRRPMKPKEQEN